MINTKSINMIESFVPASIAEIDRKIMDSIDRAECEGQKYIDSLEDYSTHVQRDETKQEEWGKKRKEEQRERDYMLEKAHKAPQILKAATLSTIVDKAERGQTITDDDWTKVKAINPNLEQPNPQSPVLEKEDNTESSSDTNTFDRSPRTEIEVPIFYGKTSDHADHQRIHVETAKAYFKHRQTEHYANKLDQIQRTNQLEVNVVRAQVRPASKLANQEWSDVYQTGLFAVLAVGLDVALYWYSGLNVWHLGPLETILLCGAALAVAKFIGALIFEKLIQENLRTGKTLHFKGRMLMIGIAVVTSLCLGLSMVTSNLIEVHNMQVRTEIIEKTLNTSFNPLETYDQDNTTVTSDTDTGLISPLLSGLQKVSIILNQAFLGILALLISGFLFTKFAIIFRVVSKRNRLEHQKAI